MLKKLIFTIIKLNHYYYMFDDYIDFDDASKEWMKNKKKKTNGMYEYVCNYIHPNGKYCKNICVASLIKTRLNEHKRNKYYYCKKHIIIC